VNQTNAVMNAYIKKYLSAAIHQAPSPDNSQPWKICWENNVLSIKYDTERVTRQTFSADSPATLLSIGAAIENLLQTASSLGIEVSPKTLPVFSSITPIYYQAEILPAKTSVKKAAISLALFERHTNRFVFQRKNIDQAVLDQLHNQKLGAITTQPVTDKQLIQAIGRLVHNASALRFRCREDNEWLAQSLRFGPQAEQRNDGLDVATLDLPPGGAVFLRLISNWQRMKWLNKLHTYQFMAWIESQPVKQAPALLAITGPKGFEPSISAGRLMQKVWISLNAKGIAVHPYYVVSGQINRLQAGTTPSELADEARQLEKLTHELFEIKPAECLYMQFRIGYPLKQPKRSKRLPLEKILHFAN